MQMRIFIVELNDLDLYGSIICLKIPAMTLPNLMISYTNLMLCDRILVFGRDSGKKLSW
jgi:hypothetical protein